MPYNPQFIGKKVTLPKLTKKQLADTWFPKVDDMYLHHKVYSVVICASRRLAWYSAALHDGLQCQKVSRDQLNAHWKIEDEANKKVLVTAKFYETSESKIDKGHLTPADAMQWGSTVDQAIEHSNDTFYYSNAAPQHKDLNRREWRLLEAYIGNESAKSGQNGRLVTFTGNVLQPDDPIYLRHQEPNYQLQIPLIFWKVIYYMQGNDLFRIGFLMGQRELILRSGLTDLQESVSRSAEIPFGNLGKFGVYQVPVSEISALTRHKFMPAQERIRPDRDILIMLKETDLAYVSPSRNPDAPGLILDDKLIELEGLEL